MSWNSFFNTNLVQTPIHEGYKYETHSDFIKKSKAPVFSNNCIFCSSTQTVTLMNDGSYRTCMKCKKYFKSKIIH